MMPTDMTPTPEQTSAKSAGEMPAIAGDFSKTSLNMLSRSLNMLLPAFGIPKHPGFTEDMTELPPQLTEVLTMIASAVVDAQDAGIDIPSINLSNLERDGQDTELGVLSLTLRELAQNKEFMKFLTQDQGA